MLDSAVLALPGPNIAGKYRIVSEIGKGPIGTVYEAVHLTLGHRVAIKVIVEPEIAADSEAVSRLLRQARAAANIKSKHVAQVYDLDVTKQHLPFVVMELLDGVDLAHFLEEEEHLPLEEAVRYTLQICHALADAHAQSIVHGNVKPENVFLQARRGVAPIAKLLDFGSSTKPPTTEEEDAAEDVRAIVEVLRKMLGKTKIPAPLEAVLESPQPRRVAVLAEELLPFAPPGLDELVVEIIATSAQTASPSASYGIPESTPNTGATAMITTSRLRNMISPSPPTSTWGMREWVLAAMLGVLLLFAGVGVSAMARRR